MDIATIVGVVSGTALIIVAILLGGNLAGFIDVTSILIVGGGTIAATLIKFPLGTVLGVFNVLRKTLFHKTDQDPAMLIKKISDMATKARKEGVLALGKEPIDHAFLKKGIQSVVDGIDPELVKSILMTELSYIEQRHKNGQKIFLAMGDSAPAFGMIGTLVGLVNMLQTMSDPSSIGPAMAVALLTTLYGAIAANLIILPMADKLGYRSEEEMLHLKLMFHGVMSIQGGDNPRVVEQKLKSFLPPKLREGGA